MADNDSDKTEQATPRRKQKAVEEGNVPKSRELSTAISFIISVIFLYFYTPSIVENFQKLFIEMLNFSNFSINRQSTYLLLIESFKFSGIIVLPLMAVLMVVGILSNVAQFGFVVSSKALEAKWERLDVIKGVKNLVSKRSLVELLKSVFKIFVVGFVAYVIVKGKMSTIISFATAEPVASVTYLGALIFEISFKIALLILIMALFDFFYQKWQYNEDLKMSKQEIKDEFKQMEGDPLIKQKIRGMQREMARRRMMEEVPKSDVVITNPTHYAVAIRYEMGKDRAPKVVAKGQRLVALRIKEMAKQCGVLIHEDPPLARSIFSSVELGEEIPESLYKAVAEILAIVYKLKNRKIG